MKRFFSILLLFALSSAAFAQKTIPQRLELVEIEVDEGSTTLEVFNMPQDGQSHYFLSVGTLGAGDDVFQFQFDPIFELFLPLGDSLDEAMESLQLMQSLLKTEPGNTLERPGCLAAAFPNDRLETVKVTYRKVLLSRMLEFSVEREGYIRATHISRVDFNSLVSGMKMYRKIHPKVK